MITIRYLREVTSPHVIAGAAWATRTLENHLAKQLIREGFAEFVSEEADPLPDPPRKEKTHGPAGSD